MIVRRRASTTLLAAIALSALLLAGCAPRFTLCGDAGCETFEASSSVWLDAESDGFAPPRRLFLELKPNLVVVERQLVPDPHAPPAGTPFDLWVGSSPPGLRLHADADPAPVSRLVSDLPPLRIGERLELHVSSTRGFDDPDEIEFIAMHPRYGFARATILVEPSAYR